MNSIFSQRELEWGMLKALVLVAENKCLWISLYIVVHPLKKPWILLFQR